MERIQELIQLSNDSFQIKWSDLQISTFRLSFLQEKCPCSRCLENRKKGALSVQKELRAIKICSVGNYALRIEFTSGCSRGVFSFSFLRKLAEGGA